MKVLLGNWGGPNRSLIMSKERYKALLKVFPKIVRESETTIVPLILKVNKAFRREGSLAWTGCLVRKGLRECLIGLTHVRKRAQVLRVKLTDSAKAISRMLGRKGHGESRVSEKFTHGLVGGVKPSRMRGFTYVGQNLLTHLKGNMHLKKGCL